MSYWDQVSGSSNQRLFNDIDVSNFLGRIKAGTAANRSNNTFDQTLGGQWYDPSGNNGMGYFANPVYAALSDPGVVFDGETNTPLKGYRITKNMGNSHATPYFGGGSAQYNQQDYDEYDANGNYIGSNKWQDLGVNSDIKALAAITAIMGGGVVGGAIAGPAAMSAAEGAVGLGGGAAGGGTATMGAGSAGLGGAGVTGLGEAGAMYAGLDAAAAGTLGGGASVAGGSALGSITPGLMESLTAKLGASGAQNLVKSALAGDGSAMSMLSSLAGPLLSAGAGIYGAKAAGDAADSQLQAAREAAALQEPWRQAGIKGLNRLTDLLGVSGNTGADGYGSLMKDFSMADYEADPGYAFRKSEQEKALQRAASPAGLLGSGKYLKDAMSYSGGLASQEFGNAFNRFQVNRSNKLNPLQSLSGVGQTAAGTIADYTTQGGNAQAAGQIGRANALTGAIGQGLSMYANNQQMNQNNALMQQYLNRR